MWWEHSQPCPTPLHSQHHTRLEWELKLRLHWYRYFIIHCLAADKEESKSNMYSRCTYCLFTHMGLCWAECNIPFLYDNSGSGRFVKGYAQLRSLSKYQAWTARQNMCMNVCLSEISEQVKLIKLCVRQLHIELKLIMTLCRAEGSYIQVMILCRFIATGDTCNIIPLLF